MDNLLFSGDNIYKEAASASSTLITDRICRISSSRYSAFWPTIRISCCRATDLFFGEIPRSFKKQSIASANTSTWPISAPAPLAGRCRTNGRRILLRAECLELGLGARSNWAMTTTHHEYRDYVFTITYQAQDPAYSVDFSNFPDIITTRRHSC